MHFSVGTLRQELSSQGAKVQHLSGEELGFVGHSRRGLSEDSGIKFCN
jgi:hypothetical protein